MAIYYRWTLRLRQNIKFLDSFKLIRKTGAQNYCQKTDENNTEDDEFPVLNFKPPPKKVVKKELPPLVMLPPRTTKMKTDQDWTNVWPGPRSFHPAVVPLPLRQGLNKHGPSPDKWANAELMKIPNFLHLTPPAIEKHCKALKKFCTAWPEALNTDMDIEKHFPMDVITYDYCYSSPSIREPLSRIVSIKIKLKHLKLDKHAKDKFLRLVGPRYDPKTDYVTITTDSCPMKKQNYDYAQYLLTALVYESWKYESWEKDKGDDDMEEYIFSSRQSLRNVEKFFKYNNKEMPDTTEYAKAIEDWHNKGDEAEVIARYKEASMKLLSLPAF